MPLNVVKELAVLEQLCVSDLRERYSQLFQETTQARNRPWLIKRIIWRMQSLDQGGLTERAIQRAKEFAACSDLRVTAPSGHDPRRARWTPRWRVRLAPHKLTARNFG